MNHFFYACALLTSFVPFAPGQEKPGEPGRIRFRVVEPAGIRRFGYPVSASIPLPGNPAKGTRFRLLEGGKPIAAQFTQQDNTETNSVRVLVDFNVSHSPMEKRDYVLEFGLDVADNSKARGLRIVQSRDGFQVVHPSGLRFSVPQDLRGFLKKVSTGKTEYLGADSIGLFLRDKSNKEHRIGGPESKGQVVRNGPLAAEVAFKVVTKILDMETVSSSVSMEFPISKSWVKVTWKCSDSKDEISGIGLDLNLKVDSEPTLVDFGAGTSVYAQLPKGQSALLRQNPTGSTPSWEALVGPTNGKLTRFVVAPGLAGQEGKQQMAEGWAHVMDGTRCTAVAMDKFQSGDEIRVDSDGRLRLWRSGGGKHKELSFWLHFVGMPVHVGAATSPQAMLAPMQVELLK